MTQETIGLLLGPAGALMLALMCLAAIVYFRWLVPAYVYEGAEERIRLLDEENEKLTAAMGILTEQNGEMKASLARLEERAKYLTEEVGTLRAEVDRLRSGTPGPGTPQPGTPRSGGLHSERGREG